MLIQCGFCGGFWSYLWGIETIVRLFVYRDSRFRFDLTYEGLKRGTYNWFKSNVAEFWSYLWGIETKSAPYKTFSTNEFWSYLWGIETPWFPNCGDLQKFVLILPMRDWNTHESNVCLVEFLFWSYLWGIETTNIEMGGSKEKAFWSYLWGIETRMPRIVHIRMFKFWSYLWGIETSTRWCW